MRCVEMFAIESGCIAMCSQLWSIWRQKRGWECTISLLVQHSIPSLSLSLSVYLIRAHAKLLLVLLLPQIHRTEKKEIAENDGSRMSASAREQKCPSVNRKWWCEEEQQQQQQHI